MSEYLSESIEPGCDGNACGKQEISSVSLCEAEPLIETNHENAVAGNAFTSVGPAAYQGDILDNPNMLWSDDVWTADKEEEALSKLLKQGDKISDYWRAKYENDAGSYWHKFYKRNADNFFKDRHYLHIVFPELLTHASDPVDATNSYRLLEVGCGVGNAVVPLVELNANMHVVAMDFAKSAVDILHQHPYSLAGRIEPHVHDIAVDELPVAIGSMDAVMCMFVISAIAPRLHSQVFAKLFQALKPGGHLFFRDYGRYDEAQLRFKKGSKLDDNFYVRQDGTCSYFFTKEELQTLALGAGFQCVELQPILRQYANRQQQKARYRAWIHMKLVKPVG